MRVYIRVDSQIMYFGYKKNETTRRETYVCYW